MHPENFFANQIMSPDQALVLFAAMFIPLWILGIVLLFKTAARCSNVTLPVRRFYLLGSLSLIIVGVAGSIDEIGLVSGPSVTGSRLVSLVAAICAFLLLIC